VPESSLCPAEVPSCSTQGEAGVLTAFRSATHQIVDVH
jgi:hypothetical protein